MSLENSQHGYAFQSALYRDLLELKDEGYLSQVINDFRAGEPGYSNKEQHRSAFLIQFNDQARWILFTTTSLRTDRVKGQQWDSDRIKLADETVRRSLLVYPDDASEKEQKAFVAQKRKYDTKSEFSRIDDIVPRQLLLAQIKERDDELLMEIRGLKKMSEKGRTLDFSGRNFERAVAAILSSHIYLETMKKKTPNKDETYKKFVRLVKGLQIEVDSVESITATAERGVIGLLPTGGTPKTDVIVTLMKKDGSIEKKNLTCKRTTKTFVSVHQYKADAIADVVDKDNETLRSLLRMFQACPVQGLFPEICEQMLAKELKRHLREFCRWVFGGHGGAGKPEQNADYIVTFNPLKEKMAVHSIDDYIALALARKPVFAGTPFQWTYASKRRGEDIQLKMPVILE